MFRLATLVIAVLACVMQSGSAIAAPIGCERLTGLSTDALGDPHARVETAVRTGQRSVGGWGAASTVAADLPRHCEVFVRLQQRVGTDGQRYAIRFHMRLPERWNGRFFFQGGAGSNGVVGSAVGTMPGTRRTALDLGYAVVSQDSGHDSAVNYDRQRAGVAAFGWDAEARRNYGYASIGAVARAAKRIIRYHYGRAPRYSYFVGGSKGGQEAFMAVQRFPHEFDGVLAGYPGFRLATAGSVGEIWDDQAFARAAQALGGVSADGLPLLGRSFSDNDLVLVRTAILAACDGLDGLVDGLVQAFPRCTTARVRPELTGMTCRSAKAENCLVPAQIDALVRVFDGARGSGDELLYATWPWDAGVGGRAPQGFFHGWRDWKIGRADADVNDARNVVLAAGTVSSVFTSPPTPLLDDAKAYTRFVLEADPAALDAASRVKWGRFGESAVDFMNADSVDLRAFAGRGGKLLIYHGVSDPVFSINDTIAWLGRVNDFEHGGASRFVRLFPIPGMTHGGGGPTVDQADLFGALVAWAERGAAPDRIEARGSANSGWVSRTRPLCVWPKLAFYAGGDAESAKSFACR